MNVEPVDSPAQGGPIGVVILAAGGSSRLGQPKQLLTHRGSTLLRHAAETALAQAHAPVVVVLGAHTDRIRAALTGLPVIIAENEDWRTGMSSSISTGLSALLTSHPETAAAIFVVCDQPLLAVTTLDDLISTYRACGRAIVASAYADTLGVPALFDRSLFPELLALQGDEGARHLIQTHLEQTSSVPFPGGVIDLDTRADCESLSIKLSPPSLISPS